jgi:hypothetical protein
VCELGPKMLLCTERERVFVYALATGLASNASSALRFAGFGGKSKKGLHVTASKMMHRERVVEALQEVCRSHFFGILPHAVSAARALVLDSKHRDHAKAVLSMLSRFGFGERTQVDMNVEVKVEDHTKAAVEDLRRLKAIGVPRSELLATFGEIGLARYERLLANEPKVIEHQPAPVGAVETAPNPMEDEE